MSQVAKKLSEIDAFTDRMLESYVGEDLEAARVGFHSIAKFGVVGVVQSHIRLAQRILLLSDNPAGGFTVEGPDGETLTVDQALALGLHVQVWIGEFLAAVAERDIETACHMIEYVFDLDDEDERAGYSSYLTELAAMLIRESRSRP